MQDHRNTDPTAHSLRKLIGAKPPLRPKHVWSIRTKLQIEGRTRDLAMFNLAIDSKLRGCDVVALKVEDVAPSGYAVDRATVRQKKTGQPVRFELTEQTRQAVDDYLRAATKKPGEFMFTGRRDSGRSITTRQYARLVSEWIACIGLGCLRRFYTTRVIIARPVSSRARQLYPQLRTTLIADITGGSTIDGQRAASLQAGGKGQRQNEAVLVRLFGSRIVCTRCGSVGADARPNWREHRAQGR